MTTKPQSTTEQTLACPFCTDTDFDMPGLKHHLLRGYCEVFESTPSLDDAVAERLRNARLDVRECEHINRQC